MTRVSEKYTHSLPKLAIITVDYNGHTDTLDLLNSYKKLDISGFEIKFIAVDNGSDMPLADMLSDFPFIELIQSGQNLGFAGGYNRGLEYAVQWGADYFLIINNDVLFEDKHLLSKLVTVLNDYPQAAAVAPKIKFAPGYEFHHERYTPADTGRVIWYAGGDFDWNNVSAIHHGLDEIDRGQFDEIQQTGYASGCCLLLRRGAVGNGQIFNTKLFAYFEDDDWLMSVKDSGKQIWYCGQTSVFHKVSRTSKIGSPFTDYLLTRNRLYFGFRYMSARTKFALIREATRQLLLGRPAQKQGIRDFLFGRFGPPPHTVINTEVKYPFKLSIAIINYKTLELTEKLLRSIYNPSSGINHVPTEVLVLDNASEDGCAQLVAAKFPQVKYIQNSVNNGFAGGNNQLISYSKGEFILLLNSDIEVRPHSLSEIVKLADDFHGRSVIAGKLWFPTGQVQDSCFHLPTVLNAFKEYFLGIKGSYFMYLPSGSQPSRVEGAVMACFLIPRRIINQVGVLSEASFMYFEDVEYCRRLKHAGIPIYYCPAAEFTHYHGAASKKIGVEKSQELLRKGSLFYHGRLNYFLLWFVLWLGQKYGRTKTPQSKWKQL